MATFVRSTGAPARTRAAPRWPVVSALPLAALALALVLSVPVLTVLASLLLPRDGAWAQLAATVLPRYVANTGWLLLGVGLGTLLIGGGAAWLVSMCRFPGSRVCEWALLLPMAMPAYLMAYTYTDLLAFAGPVQTALRGWFGWRRRGDYWFPDVPSLEGAVVVMALVLYPYVYLLARAAFLEQSASALEASRTLGRGPWRGFWEVALPLARPSLAAGVALALMEAVADFATPQYFGVDTFTTGIYRGWFGMGSPVTAAQLAAVLLLVALLLVGLERLSRGGARVHQSARRHRPPTPHALRGPRAAGALLVCAVPIALGFLVPAGVLLRMTLTGGDALVRATFPTLALNSFLLAAATGALTVGAATLVAYSLRLAPGRLARVAATLASLGYAVPGSVIAVGVLVTLGRFDNTLDAWMRATFGVSTGLLLSGSLVGLVFAYLVRFLALSLNTVDASLGRIAPSLDGAARTLGRGPLGTLLGVHAPLMRASLLTAGLLVFVDVLKELPATLIVRPFNFDTLAVRVYRLASDERLAEASTAALAIVAVGLLPVIALSLGIARSRPGAGGE